MSEEVKKEQNEQEETLYCECCGCLIDDDDYTEWNGQIICSDCLENHTTTCECCGERIWDEDVYPLQSLLSSQLHQMQLL